MEIDTELTWRDIRYGRYLKFKNYIENNEIDFDDLLYRVILEHDEEWREYCRINGKKPYLNNKLEFIFDYVYEVVEDFVQPNKITKKLFNGDVKEYRDFYFVRSYDTEEGFCYRIYNKPDKKLLINI